MRTRVALVLALASALLAAFAATPTVAAPRAASARGYYTVQAPTAAQRQEISRVGANVQDLGADAFIEATAREAEALRKAGIMLSVAPNPADHANAAARETMHVTAAKNDFPAGFEAYHTYDEMRAELSRIQQQYPTLAKVVTLGKSYEGREILAIKISSNAQERSKKPESLQTCNIHGREHLTAEMCLYLANELTSKYSSDARVKKILETLVIWIVPMQNPDGAMYDIRGGEFQMWRKNRQPSGGDIGIDLNRNYAYGWGGPGASTDPASETYRGTRAEEGVEAKVVADFIRSRKGQLKTFVDIHTFSELVMWPYGNTSSKVMGTPEYSVFETLGRKMAASNKYTPQKSSDLYLNSGGSIDWAFGNQRVWSFCFELYPGSGADKGFYPRADVIARETARNREAFLLLYENTDCMWRVTGQEARCKAKR